MSDVKLNVQLTDLEINELDHAIDKTPGVNYESGYGNLDPVAGAIVVGAVIAGAKLILRLWNEYRGGTVIDSTKQPIQIRRDRDISYGYFVLVGADGQVTVDAKDEPKDALERMISAFIDAGLGAPVDTIKTIVKDALDHAAKP